MTKGRTFRFDKQRQFSAPEIAPDAPFWAVGDVHGRYDLLAPLVDRLMETDEQIVLLGDYINKGPDSAAVLNLIRQASATGRVTALRGNHEELLLRYLVRPRVLHDAFFDAGGRATLDSFGVSSTIPVVDLREMSRLRNELREQLGELEGWLADLPYYFQSGNIAAVHAGADPTQPIGTQFGPALCWGHPKFTKQDREDDLWVVHGHVPVEVVSIKERRIAMNTLADQSGVLSAVRIAPGEVVSLL